MWLTFLEFDLLEWLLSNYFSWKGRMLYNHLKISHFYFSNFNWKLNSMQTNWRPFRIQRAWIRVDSTVDLNLASPSLFRLSKCWARPIVQSCPSPTLNIFGQGRPTPLEGSSHLGPYSALWAKARLRPKREENQFFIFYSLPQALNINLF